MFSVAVVEGGMLSAAVVEEEGEGGEEGAVAGGAELVLAEQNGPRLCWKPRARVAGSGTAPSVPALARTC